MPPFGRPSLGRTARSRRQCSSAILPSPLSEPSRATLESYQDNSHVSPNPYLHRAPATDSRRSADPTSRMGQVQWRMSHMRFLRVAPYGAARRFDANGIQWIYRTYLGGWAMVATCSKLPSTYLPW